MTLSSKPPLARLFEGSSRNGKMVPFAGAAVTKIVMKVTEISQVLPEDPLSTVQLMNGEHIQVKKNMSLLSPIDSFDIVTGRMVGIRIQIELRLGIQQHRKDLWD